ncbi:hypothetical protein BaRGS_00018426 [Batillaria attramentaria]|uniref:Immunoglobulin domain-containing protein n=1 Tax=Batillaria attramentaria TaxID=370345 RepID=A0ABD0KSW0_9CAEN
MQTKLVPLSKGTPRTQSMREKLKQVVNEIKDLTAHGVDILHPVPDEYKTGSKQRNTSKKANTSPPEASPGVQTRGNTSREKQLSKDVIIQLTEKLGSNLRGQLVNKNHLKRLQGSTDMDLSVLYLLYTVAVTTTVYGWKTTCDAPLAVLGETARVTCHFSSDITAIVPRPSFNVRRADHENFDYHRDTVLDCDWVNADLLCMTIKDGYQFNKDVSDQLTITIPNVTHEHSGQYVCQAVAVTQDNQIEPCRLTVTGTLPSPDEARTKVSISTTTEFPSSTTGRTHSAAPVKEGSVDITVIVLPILGVALLVIVILAFLRYRKRSKRGNDGNDREQVTEAAPDQPECHEETLDTFSDSTPLMQQPSTGNTDSSLPEASEGFAATSNSTSPDHLQPERHEEIASTVSKPPPPVQPPTANTDSSLPEASAGNEATSKHITCFCSTSGSSRNLEPRNTAAIHSDIG